MTDHKHAAEDHLETAKSFPDMDTSTLHTGWAQVHATLALADATRAQTLVLERMERNGQTRTVGL